MLFEVIISLAIFTVLYVNIFHILLNIEKKKETLKEKKEYLPFVSLIIPAYNEAKNVGDTIKSILKQDYPKNKYEILVIDDGSSDKTYQEVKKIKDKSLRVFKRVHGGKAKALNFGIKKAKGELIATVDADSSLDENALKNCVELFDDNNVGAVTSKILPKERSNLLGKLQYIEFLIISVLRRLQEKVDVIPVTPGPLSLFRKDILEEIGYFDEKNLTEDIEMAWRLHLHNYKIKMSLESKVYSRYPNTMSLWWKQRTRWNLGGFQTAHKYFGIAYKTGRKNALSTFILPLYLSGYILTTLGVFIAVYLFSMALYSLGYYLFESLSIGMSPLFLFRFPPIDMFVFLGCVCIFTSVLLMRIGFKEKEEKMGFFAVIMYLTIYTLIFPVLLVYSIYKYLKGDLEWLTK